ncbi:MAG: hypothetical protein WCA46_27845 [Actinocatenispora sp.]
MVKRLAWVGRNLDGALALALAFGVAILGVFNVVDQFVVESATLLILALLAEVLLRERWRRSQVEREIRDGLGGTAKVLAALREPLDDLTAAGEVVTQARAALARQSMVQVLDSGEIRSALTDAWSDTDRWHFKGGTGAHLHAVTLPACIESARRRKGGLQVRLEILDPLDETACRRYAAYRTALSTSGRGTAGGEQWTLDTTRKESFATILAACWYQQHNSLLDLEVRLSPVMTTFRWDMSSRWIMVTEEDPKAPALLIDRGTFYYDRWATELSASLAQARPVPIGTDRQVRLGARPTVDETRRLLDSVGTPLPRTFSDRDVTDIVKKAIEPRDPYE